MRNVLLCYEYIRHTECGLLFVISHMKTRSTWRSINLMSAGSQVRKTRQLSAPLRNRSVS